MTTTSQSIPGFAVFFSELVESAIRQFAQYSDPEAKLLRLEPNLMMNYPNSSGATSDIRCKALFTHPVIHLELPAPHMQQLGLVHLVVLPNRESDDLCVRDLVISVNTSTLDWAAEQQEQVPGYNGSLRQVDEAMAALVERKRQLMQERADEADKRYNEVRAQLS